MEAIRTYAQSSRLSLGKAASQLVRRGFRYQLGTKILHGIPVFDVPDDFPILTAARVEELLDEE